MIANGQLVGLHVNPNGGVPKLAVNSLEVNKNGCVGDKQNNRKHHGGPQKAVCLFCHELLEHLSNEGHPIFPGSTGENVLISGLNPETLGPGVVLEIGDVVLEITEDAHPCKKIESSFTDGLFSLLSHKQHPYNTRWYAKVLREGHMSNGDEVHQLQ